MKTIISLLLLLGTLASGAQGRVVINEYMPWTANGCSPTSEFIELLNFGPGPVDIGCYVLTEGDYAITIPPNTILQPGQFYVIAGQDVIAAPCANIDVTITAHLNWNTCTSCVSAPIPTTGDGLFTDGGSASEQLVLFDPAGNVADAVVRDISLRESSATITTTASGCTPRTFDLDNMTINYEMIGESAGRANSFARRVDGDCGWLKDSRQSANGTNNTAGETNSVNYTLHLTQPRDCGPTQRGAVVITVPTADVAAIFPASYIVAFDANADGQFTQADVYTPGTDNTPPHVEFSGLTAGRYRILVGSALGCNLKLFEFDILSCTAVLPIQLRYFRHEGTVSGTNRFGFRLAGGELLNRAILEQSTDGTHFTPAAVLRPSASYTGNEPLAISGGRGPYFRLRLEDRNGTITFSPVISLRTGVEAATVKAWPNPASTTLWVEALSGGMGSSWQLHNNMGAVVRRQHSIAGADGRMAIPLQHLPAGIYYLALQPDDNGQPIRLQFVKR